MLVPQEYTLLINNNSLIWIGFALWYKKLVTLVESDPKAPFSIATTPRCRRMAQLLSLDCSTYLIVLSTKQGKIKYHFLSLWYDTTWDWTQVSRTIGEHLNHYNEVNLLLVFSVWLFSEKHLSKQNTHILAEHK